MAKPHVERSCVVCRARGHKRGFLRFVLADGLIRLDMSGRLPGRGAYLCRSIDCISAALVKKGLFSRAFKKEADPAHIRVVLDSARDIVKNTNN